jgi:hypothetical protein
MYLLEFFNFDDSEVTDDKRYNSSRDDSVIHKSDTRKIRLTLKQINQLRLTTEAHRAEKDAEFQFVSKMYAIPAEQPAI